MLNSDVQVVLSPEIYMMRCKILQDEIEFRDKEIQKLQTQLEYERELRERLEAKWGKFLPDEAKKTTRKKRDVTPETNAYSDFKSDGKRKPHAADSIRSYDDFHAIEQYFLDKGCIRDWAMWVMGVSLGLRISDLLALRFGHFIDIDKTTIKPRVQIYEQKTGKLNGLLVTEAVKFALQRYLESIKFSFDLNDYLFSSKKTKGKMKEECGWRILSNAGKTLNLPLSIGSHTMRKSFANIVACVDKSCVDMNSITKVQGLLNHSDQKVTMTYLRTYQDMYDRARVAVSDFVLGKTGINEIAAGSQYTTDDLMERIDALGKLFSEKGSIRDET